MHLRRAFGFGNTTDFDPFLLLDDFRNDIPEDYLAGFPWHPHRGIETITYVLAGTVEHGDSMGNHGAIAAGDIQWMTAGSGIIHQEMPKGDPEGRMHGFQLWANLPASLKMTAPRYQEVKAPEIPLITDDDGTRRSHCLRNFLGQERPGGRDRRRSSLSRCVRAAGPPEDSSGGDNASRLRLCFCRRREILQRLRSACRCRPKRSAGWILASQEADNRSLVLFDRGDEVDGRGRRRGIRFLLVSGKPLEEPVAWYGPIVMNTQEQLRQAFADSTRARSSAKFYFSAFNPASIGSQRVCHELVTGLPAPAPLLRYRRAGTEDRWEHRARCPMR